MRCKINIKPNLNVTPHQADRREGDCGVQELLHVLVGVRGFLVAFSHRGEFRVVRTLCRAVGCFCVPLGWGNSGAAQEGFRSLSESGVERRLRCLVGKKKCVERDKLERKYR